MSESTVATLPATRRALWPALRRRRPAVPRVEHGVKAAGFGGQFLPLLLLTPQLLILILFFFIPAVRGLAQAFLLQDPFGQEVHFVGLENITSLLRSAEYRESLRLSVVFTAATTVLTFSAGLVLAFATDRVTRGRNAYRAVLLMPYAIAPAIAGFVWAFLFNPLVGPAATLLHSLGIAWDPNRNGQDAMLLVILTASWKHLCYDYIFLVAALGAVPRSVIEAAAVDGAGPLRRFVWITLPMIAPTVFFLLIMNTVYGLFETFAIIDAATRGGPAAATSILVYKVYVDGFINLDLGSSAAQSVLLMIFAVALTVIQFRLIERRISYDVSQ
ncbi:ABC transporter permease subunit [Roseomonas sp. KE2513]|uniref:ABC transporter permease subunit n=1 Tax=Roseomonas sp. KE2513 TaxID=2479202 RepID=UPI0018DF5B55|nr:ABC transporter permease subunit [Roseomonas sp. KE2513]MBI0537241.1 ABC transporter permease subunit [Roseomonas sp. KE2513]